MHKALLLLKKIPRGKVTTYGELSKVTHSSPRAIGQIMKRNPSPDLYPCYKVIGSNGSLGGYCGHSKGKSMQKKILLLKKDKIVIENGKIDLKKYLHRF